MKWTLTAKKLKWNWQSRFQTKDLGPTALAEACPFHVYCPSYAMVGRVETNKNGGSFLFSNLIILPAGLNNAHNGVICLIEYFDEYNISEAYGLVFWLLSFDWLGSTLDFDGSFAFGTLKKLIIINVNTNINPKVRAMPAYQTVFTVFHLTRPQSHALKCSRYNRTVMFKNVYICMYGIWSGNFCW